MNERYEVTLSQKAFYVHFSGLEKAARCVGFGLLGLGCGAWAFLVGWLAGW